MRLDHAAIFLFIAGSYTPFVLGRAARAWGWTLFGLVWGLAVIGVVAQGGEPDAPPVVSTGLYI
jgi:hemolysin III